ncbi:MAG TPA: hypothetical protein PLX35_07575 [Cyclobacteriaceae bacterium]|nr:hypothetical protein [Cyclobacteriaceae bacterium]
MAKKLLQFLASRNLERQELSDEKMADFRRATVVQGGIILTLFLLPLFSHLGFPYHIQIAETIFFLVLGVYVFLLWDMLRNYTANERLIRINFVLIMGVFLLGFVAVNPFFPMPVNPVYRSVLAFIQGSLLIVEGCVIYFTLQEFFRKDLGLGMRLWGAACIYLMIGLAFGSAYELVCILDIQCLGVDLPLQTMAFMKRIEFSFIVLSGMDNPYGAVAGMVTSLATVEALFGQLFVVLIVGRLLVK